MSLPDFGKSQPIFPLRLPGTQTQIERARHFALEFPIHKIGCSRHKYRLTRFTIPVVLRVFTPGSVMLRFHRERRSPSQPRVERRRKRPWPASTAFLPEAGFLSVFRLRKLKGAAQRAAPCRLK